MNQNVDINNAIGGSGDVNLMNGQNSKMEQELYVRNNLGKSNNDFEDKPVYGLCGFKVKIFQRFLSAKWALFWLCWAGALQGLTVNGCINVVITTIEKRFGLRSSQTGLVASGYDIASFLCLVPVTYFGGRINASKPRWIGWGVILMGMGSLTFALPHFLVGPYRASSAISNVCFNNSTMKECSRDPLQADAENLSWNVWLFFLAQLLHGAGASPLFTLGVTYIDENVSKKMSSVYLATYYTMAIIGPALGYVFGGQLLLIYTDFLIVDPLANTAYFGFLEICEPKIGETVVVSGAAGAVGSLVGQIAKIKGCTVIGIAGSDEKCNWLKSELGFDQVINYKTENISTALRAAAPNGVDCYFDNVGGEISSIILSQMNSFGRIACCGSISSYNYDVSDRPKVSIVQPSMVFLQLKMEGFVVSRWSNRWMEGIRQMLKWIKEGKLKYHETITDGFENTPLAFIEMLQGKNVGKAVVKALGLTPQSKVWVGAWWIGFIFVAVLCVLLAIPILAYPRSLPGSLELQQDKVSEAHNGSDAAQKYSRLKDMPHALWTLLKNPTFFFLNLAGASEGLIIAGFCAFLPKLIENQFSVTAVWSAMLMGLITVPAGGGGTFLGGYLVKKFNLTCAGIIKLCLFATIIATIFTICFMLSCPNLTFAGVTASYFPQTTLSTEARKIDMHHGMQYSLDSSCNSKCACNRKNYDPICGVDGVMYYSPCHAGCSKELNMENSKVYLDCDCINAPNSTQDRGFDAINTMCETSCSNLWLFVALCFFVMLFTFLATMPALSATLRCVHDNQRSFALGIQWIKVRILGTIPAPMIFGTLIDNTCILWQESCDDAGACLVYDNLYMSKYMLALAVIGKACSIIFFFGAWWCYIPPKQVNKSMENGTDQQVVVSQNGNSNLVNLTENKRY